MSFQDNITTVVTRIGTEFKAIRAEMGDFSTLDTTAKNTLVAAINEIKTIADSALSGGQTAAEVQTAIDAALAALVDTAPGTLDTLNKLAAALGDDPNFAATITSALALKANAADVYTKTELGDPTTNYIPAFEAALL